MATVLAGTPVDPRNILRTIQIAAEKAGMGHMGVHTLRHSAAVVWLEQGVHIKAVAKTTVRLRQVEEKNHDAVPGARHSGRRDHGVDGVGQTQRVSWSPDAECAETT